MEHQVLEAGSAALAEIIDELARVQRVSKCTGCECFLAVVRAIDSELAPINCRKPAVSERIFARGWSRVRHDRMAVWVARSVCQWSHTTSS